jgi:hypothetical protein
MKSKNVKLISIYASAMSLTSRERDELAGLRKRVCELGIGRDFLKKPRPTSRKRAPKIPFYSRCRKTEIEHCVRSPNK